MGISTSYTTIMHAIIFVTLVSAAYSMPQIVPYVHEEIPAEPYVHQEIKAEPYVHIEPEISPLALGIVRPNAAPAAPQQFAAPAQQQFVPQQQFAAPVQQQFVPQQQFAQPQLANGAWAGGCYNNLGEGVPCRQKFN